MVDILKGLMNFLFFNSKLMRDKDRYKDRETDSFVVNEVSRTRRSWLRYFAYCDDAFGHDTYRSEARGRVTCCSHRRLISATLSPPGSSRILALTSDLQRTRLAGNCNSRQTVWPFLGRGGGCYHTLQECFNMYVVLSLHIIFMSQIFLFSYSISGLVCVLFCTTEVIIKTDTHKDILVFSAQAFMALEHDKNRSTNIKHNKQTNRRRNEHNSRRTTQAHTHNRTSTRTDAHMCTHTRFSSFSLYRKIRSLPQRTWKQVVA